MNKPTCKELVKPDELSVKEFAILEVSKITVPSALHTLKAYLQPEELRIVEYHLYVTARINTDVISSAERPAYDAVGKADIAWVKGGLIGRLCMMEIDDILCFMDVLAAEARQGYIW